MRQPRSPSEVSDVMANSARVSQYTNEVLSTKAGPAALSSASQLCNKAVNKAPQCASLSKASSVKFASRSEAMGSSLGTDSGAYTVRVLPKLSAAKLELKHYLVPIASVVRKRTRHRPVLRFQGLRMLSPSLIKL